MNGKEILNDTYRIMLKHRGHKIRIIRGELYLLNKRFPAPRHPCFKDIEGEWYIRPTNTFVICFLQTCWNKKII